MISTIIVKWRISHKYVDVTHKAPDVNVYCYIKSDFKKKTPQSCM